MSVFADTSGIYALLDRDDQHWPSATRVWRSLVDQRQALVSTNYVLVETFALIGRRLGPAAARAVQKDLLPVLRIHWVDQALHEKAASAFLTANSRDLSIVDCASFEVMRQLGIEHAFAADAHFVQQGFQCLL